ALAALAWTVHLALALRRPRCGVVVAYNPFTALGVALAKLLGRSPPFVVRVIGNIASKALVVHRSQRRARLLAAVERFALRHADLVVPMGPFTRDLARRAGAPDDRIVALPHPTRWFGTEVGGGEAGGPVRIVAAGRLVASKGFDVLLRAFATLACEVDDVVLEIAGEGPERERLEGLGAELGLRRQLRFHGWLSSDRMPDFYAGALVSVLPSRVEEGLPMVLVEAGLAGCALVGSDHGGIRDIVRPLSTGVLVPPDDPPALADALRRLLADADEARRLGAGARDAAVAWIGDREDALNDLRQRIDELHRDRPARRLGRAR
ncbi:MAG: glycosyltransferase family 4 protein, partial [Actinomycetota bacterium]|nr:glycosyltransferase family 4 protein [Actinomycetota bacterium]